MYKVSMYIHLTCKEHNSKGKMVNCDKINLFKFPKNIYVSCDKKKTIQTMIIYFTHFTIISIIKISWIPDVIKYTILNQKIC